jgi:beta-glucanase (GH16 family)
MKTALRQPRRTLAVLCCAALCLATPSRSSLRAEEPAPVPTSEAVARPVVDLSLPDAERVPRPSNGDLVSVSRPAKGPGLDIKVAPGPAAYPGIAFILPAGSGNFSDAGYIEARVTNTCEQIISVALRVDSAAVGEAAAGSATGSAYLKPGASGVARVYFSRPSKGSPPLVPAALSAIHLFIGKHATETRSFRLESLTAGGRPGDAPVVNRDLVRIKPAGGVIFGGAEKIQPAKQLVAREGATTSVGSSGSGTTIDVAFNGQPGQHVLFKPLEGFWDLGDYLQVTVRVKNTGAVSASPTVQLSSRGGRSDFGLVEKPLPAGATADLVIPFIPRTPFSIISDPAQGVLETKKNWSVQDTPGARFTSHQTNGLIIAPAGGSPPSSFQILSITASLPPAPKPPAWLGQRPPAEGEWVKTFEDNFDGTTLDLSKWSPHGSNFWDKRVHFTRDNVILGDGFARLRIEKKTGRHNDAPDGKLTEFATGWLESYGKWTQRYGYFEVRVKLPTAPSMFPAFWLMPERGPADWPRHRRTDTKDGGMEFDVFEGQSMWGPYRTTFVAHFDNYGKYHKVAAAHQYNQPDAEGFLTIGMLWLPGHISAYSLGRKQGSWDSPRVGSVQSYLIFDMLPGGFEYDPLDPATLPADLVIDYVRVWQRQDLASPEDGPKSGR